MDAILCSFFHFMRRFWNQILICLSVKHSACAISIRLLLVRYRLKWNSFSSSNVWYRVYEVLCLFVSPLAFTVPETYKENELIISIIRIFSSIILVATAGVVIFRSQCMSERQWILGSIGFVPCHACSIVMYS